MNKPLLSRGSFAAVRALLAVGSVCCLALSLSADTHTWDGSVSGYWSLGANWTSGIAPVNGDALVFPNDAIRFTTTNDLLSSVTGITISGSGHLLRGATLSVSDTISATYPAGFASEVELALLGIQTIECVNAGAALYVNGNIYFGATGLVIDGAGNTSFGGTISGTGGVAKYGTGVARLLGATANTYTGTTRVNVGTLELSKLAGIRAMAGDLVVGNNTGDPETVRWLSNSQLWSPTTGVTVNRSAVLDLNGRTDWIGDLTLNGGDVETGAGLLTLDGNLMVLSNTTTAVIAGNLSLGGATRTVTVHATPLLAFGLDVSARIIDGGASAGINWVGEPLEDPETHGYFLPEIHLSGLNSYTGVTLCSNLNASIAHPLALGGTNEGTILAGGSLTLESSSVTNETLRAAPGMFRCTLQSQSTGRWAGSVVAENELLLETWDVGDFLIVDGQISGSSDIYVISSPGGSVTFAGSHVNTYTGNTHVNFGTLNLSKTGGNAITGGQLIIGNGNTTGATVMEHANYQIGSIPVTINCDGFLDLDIWDDTLSDVTLVGGQIRTESGNLTLSGNLTVLYDTNRQAKISNIGSGNLVLNSTRTFTITNTPFSPDLNLDIPISGAGGFTKTGDGAVGLSRANTFSGAATINDGLVYLYNDYALGATSGGTVVGNGGVLVLANDRHVADEALTLNGSGDGSAGALTSIGGSNSWSGTVTLATDSVITVQTNRYLNLLGVVAGPAGFIKKQPGTLILSGDLANTFAGSARAYDGTLVLDKNVMDGAVPGPGQLIVGDGAGGSSADLVREERDYQIHYSVNVTVNSSGLFDLHNHTDSVGDLNLYGGVVMTGAGLLTLVGDTFAESADGSPGMIFGRLSLGTGLHTITVTYGDWASDLMIFGDVSGSADIVVNGGAPASGVLDLYGSNSFTGTLMVNDSVILILNDDNALGATNAGTIINDSAYVVFGGEVDIADEPLTLNSIYSLGTLFVSDGTNSWSGPITLQQDATVSGVLGGGCALELSGPIGGVGGLAQRSDVTLILSGPASNTFGGTTRVNGGTLVLQKTGTDRAIPGNLVIGDGTGGAGADVVRLKSSNQIANTADVSIASSGLLDLGSFYDRMDAVTGTGSVTLGSAASHLIAGNNNSSFTFDGLVSGTGYLWKVGNGTWTLTGNNTYSGLTYIETGTLAINGSQPGSDVEIGAAGTLGGGGTVGKVTSTSGSVSPGLSAGTLTCSNLLFDGTSEFVVELGNAGSDRLNVRGKAGLANASLVLAATGLLPSEGQQFVILNNDDTDAVTGTFSGLAEGAVINVGPRRFRISYLGGTGNDVVLTATNTAALRPTLTIWRTATNTVVVSWPSSDINWLLHATAELAEAPASWTELPPPYGISGPNLQYIEPTSVDNQFFRLHYP